MKIILNDLISKVANVALSTILISNGLNMNTATNAGNIIEGFVMGISIRGKNDIYEKMLSIYKNAIQTAFKIKTIELPYELEDELCTQLLQKENLLKYLDCNLADKLMTDGIKSVFIKYNVPYEEQNINIFELTYIIMNKIYKEILNDHDLVIIHTNIIVNIINEKIVTLELLSQKLLDYFDDINIKNNNISKNNQKKLFIKKWNSPLFLHKSSEMSKGNIKLSSLYLMPYFLFNNKKKTNLDIIFWEFLENDSKRLITILGNPGLGKSSLMCYLAQRYEKFSNFIFIRMYELEPAKAYNSLLDAITDFLECKNRDLKNKVLFLDGYDELRVDNRHYELCLQLVSEIYSISGLKVIISSRLNYIDLDKNRYKSDFGAVDTIELIPFDKNQMFKFIQRYNRLDCNKNDTRLLKQFQRESTDKEIFGIPFILYLICSLDIDIDNIQNIFNIYDKVFAFNGGIYDKIYDTNSGHYLTRNPENKKELLSISQLFAFEMFKVKSIELSMQSVSNLVRLKYPKRENDFAIGNYYNIDTNRLMFVHKTFYEYFLCKYIIENLKIIFLNDSSNDEILNEIWNLFHKNYIYKRLENLLELALKEDDTFGNIEITNRFKKSCQYILEKFAFISTEYNNLETNYCELQNFLSSICKIFKLVLGVGWIKTVQLKNTYWGLLLKNKGYVRIDLEYIDLKNIDLSGTVLRGNLINSTFVSCNMCRVDIYRCNAEYSKWTDTDIKLAYAVKAKLNNLIFEKGAFDLSNLGQSELCDAKISNATFNLIDGNEMQFNGSILSNVEFKGAKLNYADFKESRLENVRFCDVLLDNANFNNATLNNVVFSNANLRYADFRGAIFTKIIIEDTKMDKAIFDESGIKWLINAGIKIDKHILIETNMSNFLITYGAYKKQLKLRKIK